MKLVSERLTVEDSPEALADFFYRKGWTDGLPIIPPTADRVERMLAGLGRPPADSLGLIPPSLAELTVEKIAINAVLAGCLPIHFPAIVAALGAMLDPQFNMNGVQCTTSAATPVVVFNGPIRGTAEINSGAGAFAPSSRGNAVIGRAIRLAMLSVGGATPGDIDKAALGQPGKFAFCFGENEELNPWEPYHVELGFEREQSVVTVIPGNGSIEVRDSFSKSAEGILKTYARSITSAGFVAASNSGTGAQAVIVCTPDHVKKIHDDGFSKVAAKELIWSEARMSLDDFSPETAEHIVGWRRSQGLPDTGEVRVTKRPEDLILLVAGGSGTKSAFIPTWGGSVRSVTRLVQGA